jgi:hypothetical protein
VTVSHEPRAPVSSEAQESSALSATRPRPRPSLFDIVFVIWAIVIPVAFGYRLLNSDGDLARHLRIGEVMLERGAMLREYPFAHTVTGRPFLAFEWGSEVVYAAVHRAAGLAGIAVFAGLLLALTYALLVRFLIRQGGDPLLAYVVSMVAAVLSAAHWLARPHLFTMCFVVVLLGLLERRGRRTLWLYVPLFVVWANLHGGFFYGCILIGLFAVGELLEGFVSGDREVWFTRSRHHGAALALALAASLVNPHGFALLAHVGGFFGNSAILQQTQEFMSPNFHTVNGKLFLLALLGMVAALALSRRRPTVPVLLVLMANLAFSLISQRNIEFFALVALPLVALHLDAEWRGLPVLRRVKEVFQREHAGSYGGLSSAVVGALLVVLALRGGAVAGLPLVPDRFDGKAFPVAAVERARAAGLEGRLFNHFIWGGYVLYAWPEQRAFIDGGTDFYGEEVFTEYLRVWNLDPRWDEVLRKYGITLTLIPPQSRLAHELIRDRRWTIWYCDSTAAILRPPTASTGSESTSPADSALTRCGARTTGPR